MNPKELRIYKTTKENIFNESDKYIVPLYQRAYAWSDDEINLFIEDIWGNESENYYIGSLIVHRRTDDDFEVIDGQQRLTTLFLLLSYLDTEMKQNLSFDCRKRSNLTLQNMIENDSNKKINESDIEPTLYSGKEIINTKFIIDKIDKEEFKEKLSKVVLYRIEVPEGTDLNRYFEIMNTRGEQLEQHDVLKAKFMELIGESEIRNNFAEVWEACSDMTGYVQMNMSKQLREKIFKSKWNSFPKFEEYVKSLGTEGHEQSTGKKQETTFDFNKQLNFILYSKAEDFKLDALPKDGDEVRFESPINFTYFLLHVLRVYIDSNKFKIQLPRLIEDINLLKEYKLLFEEKKKAKNLSVNFLDCLLKCRYLMDYYIIKREYNEENRDGDWSLKRLKKSEEETASYSETFKTKKHNLMLQAAMRVSFTSPKIMHWITESLLWLYKRNGKRPTNDAFQKELKSIINESVRENLFEQENYESMGVKTPHIAFNYLDYLLWEEEYLGKNNKFNFEYRTSIEHWFPQNPSGGTFKQWEQEEVDNFGNLCIIQRNVNSKFSNLEPHSKKATFEEMIRKGSLKLRIMADKTTEDVKWEDIYKEHGEEMLDKLASACGFDRKNQGD